MDSMAIVRFFCFLVALSPGFTSRGASFNFRHLSKTDNSNLLDEADLASLLHFQPAHQEDVFSQALQLLDSLNSSPSCNRIAASRLLTSCQSIKGGGEEHGKAAAETLDFVKSLYAARLAVCELTGAGATLPTDCSPVASPSVTLTQLLNPHQSILASEEDRVPSGQLERCLKSLESRPQWWTSYSNSRQNAVVMCQAARMEIDKEELLSLHRTVTETTSSITRELKDSLKRSIEESSRNKEFMEAAEAIRAKLIYDLEDTSSLTRGLFSTLFQDAGDFLRDTVKSVVSTVKGAEFHAEALNQKLEESNNGVDDLKGNIRSTYEELVERRTAFSATQKRDHETNHALAVAVQQSLESIKRQNLDEMEKEFGEIHFALASTLLPEFPSLLLTTVQEGINQLVASMYYKQNSLDERLQTFDESFKKFEQQAGDLHTTHAQHADEQLQLQESIRSQIQIARALLDEVTSAAANLQTSVEETSASFGSILGPGFWSPFPYLAWIYFSFITFGLLNPKAALAAVLICIPVLLFLANGVSIPNWTPSIPQFSFENFGLSSYPQIPTLSWLGLATLVIVGIVFILHQTTRFKIRIPGRLSRKKTELGKETTICPSCFP